MIEYSIIEGGNIRRNSDNAGIPKDETNKDYQDFLTWQSQGNTPEALVAKSVNEIWSSIKQIRDNKTVTGGFRVGNDWFHSDTFSRTQHIALIIMGANIPVGLKWKTMGGLFVEMTPLLATQIFASAAKQDASLFAYAEYLRLQTEQASNPERVDIINNWPETFYDTPEYKLSSKEF